MVKEPLYLPGDKQELFDRYLDKTAHADLIERLRVITGALQNKLTPQKLRLHRIDRTDAITLFHERQKLTKKMFQAVVGKHGKIDPVGTDEIDPVKTA